MIPNDWEYKSLEQISKVIDCKHRTPKYVKDGIPLVSPGTIKWGSIDLLSPTKRVTNSEYESLMDHCSVELGDLVLSRNQSVGVASFVDTNNPFVLGQDTVLVKPTNSDSKFLFYNLQSVDTQRMIFKLAGGSTFSRINLGDIRQLKSIYPPLPEQRKIANILGTWDKAITTTEKLIATSKQQKKALMQQLLTGKKRLLNPETGKAFEGEWENTHLKTLLNEEKMRNRNSDIIRVLSVTNHSGFVLPENQFSKRVASDNVSNYKVVKKGQFGYNPSRLNVGSFARLEQYNEGILSPMYVIFSVDETKLTGDYLNYWMQTNEAKQRIKNSTQGSVRESVGFNALCGFPFKLPCINEQQKIASVLTAADKEIELLGAKLAHLKQEKKALMQQLLTGKRRVKVDESEAA